MESGLKDMDFNFRVPVIPIDKLKSRLGLMASRYYRDPSQDLNIIGITGTNGKTSIAYYLAQLFSKADSGQVGSIGTLGAGVFGQLQPGINTTPDVFIINELLSDFRAKQIHHVVMEVSSHGLEQGRVDNIQFETAVFTNLSRDHLDYHGDMVAYGEAKRKLFTSPGLKNAVINIDDEYGSRLFSELHNRINSISYGIVAHSSNASVKPEVNAEILVQDINSLSLNINSPWGSSEVILPLSGEFNAYNILACLAVLCLHDMQFDNVLESLRGLKPVPGRMEAFVKEGYPGIFVDYSHTPDALKHALSYLKDHCNGRLVCVFGCGGDRDKGKRPVMGAAAEQYADLVYLTSDNPRNEPPEQIIDDIRKGMKGLVPIVIEQDRTMAITEAINSAKPEDIILVAGKGHETYQEIGNKRLPFSDRQLVRNLLEGDK
jgi:UDP-N-acetylmuramoyl-L-alanyl-D-glutamate--2,6-diaminopimelate ligase